MKKNSVRLAILAFFCACLSCSIQQVAGGDVTDTGNAAVAATVYNTDGSPAVFAKVSLRPQEYTPSRASRFDKRKIRDVYTDTAGQFVIDSLDTGSFVIEIDNGRREGALLTYENSNPEAHDRLESAVLAPMAKILGKVTASTQADRPAMIQIPGLERNVPIDLVTGEFSVKVPAGVFTLEVITGSGEVLSIGSISAGAGSVAHFEAGEPHYFSLALHLNTTGTGANIQEDLLNFPILVRLDATNFDFGRAASGPEYVRFLKTDGTLLVHEVELWDPIQKSAAIWVKLDTVLGNSTTQKIRMLWGGARPSQSDPHRVFDTASGFVGVWHLDSSAPGVGSSGVYPSSTVHRGDGIDRVSAPGKEGIIGRGQQFNGVDDYIDCGNDRAFALTDTLTISAWVRLEDTAQGKYYRVMSKKEPWYSPEGFDMEINTTENGSGLTIMGPDSSFFRSRHKWDTSWHHCAIVVTGTTVTHYIDGREFIPYATSAEKWPIRAGDQSLLLGGIGNDDFMRGFLDEIRLERTARSYDWLRLCYENQKLNQNFVTLRTE